MFSRNSEPFLRRAGLIVETESPSPRLDVSALRVGNLPQTGNITSETLVVYEGQPPPDRGSTRAWPYA